MEMMVDRARGVPAQADEHAHTPLSSGRGGRVVMVERMERVLIPSPPPALAREPSRAQRAALGVCQARHDLVRRGCGRRRGAKRRGRALASASVASLCWACISVRRASCAKRAERAERAKRVHSECESNKTRCFGGGGRSVGWTDSVTVWNGGGGGSGGGCGSLGGADGGRGEGGGRGTGDGGRDGTSCIHGAASVCKRLTGV